MKCEFTAFQNKVTITVALLFATVQSLASETPQVKQIKRELTVEIDAVKGASSYQVKISPTGRTKSKETIHNFKDTKISMRLGLGSYKVQSRSIDLRGVGGPWADLGNITIAFSAPKILLPKANAEFRTLDGKKATVKFSWETFSESAQYQVEILDSSNATFISQTVEGSSWTTNISPGSYIFKLTSRPPADTPREGNDPNPIPFSVKQNQLGDPVITRPKKLPLNDIAWKNVTQAKTYHVLIEQIADTQTKILTPPKEVLSQSTESNTLKIPENLDAGTYKFSVRAESEGYTPSRTRSLTWKIRPTRKPVDPSTKTDKIKTQGPAPAVAKNRFPTHIGGDIGPVLWSYQFNAEGTNNSFALMALTSTAASFDAVIWPFKYETTGIGFEIYGRQTNIKLFEDGNTSNADQKPVSVEDRRAGGIVHYRKTYSSSSIDLLGGLGIHSYTYLIQDASQKVIAPETGSFSEYTLGGSYTSLFESGSFITFDLKLNPVKSSEIILINNSRQYSSSLKFGQSVIKDRAFLTYRLESLRTSLDVTSPRFSGNANVISSWYRLGLGLNLYL